MIFQIFRWIFLIALIVLNFSAAITLWQFREAAVDLSRAILNNNQFSKELGSQAKDILKKQSLVIFLSSLVSVFFFMLLYLSATTHF